MHDQPKVKEPELDEAGKQQLSAKVAHFCELRAAAFKCREEGDYSRRALEVTKALLDQSPENYTVFAFRRKVWLSLWSAATAAAAAASAEEPSGGASGGQTKEELDDLMAELVFSTGVVTKDPKCYCAWLHRRWIIERLPLERRLLVLKKDNAQCEALLMKDERNFHAWGYRRWVTAQLAAHGQFSEEQELDFAQGKVEQNFSNYSAWHNRALVLRRRVAEVIQEATTTPIETAAGEAPSPAAAPSSPATLAQSLPVWMDKELDLVVRAFYCDPADQSAWFYGEFLIQQAAAVKPRFPAVAAAVETALSGAVGELLAAEGPLTWPLWLRTRLAKLNTGDTAASTVESLRLLGTTDATHAGIYRDWLAAAS